MIIIKQFENKNILVVDTASLKAKLWIKNLWYFATEAWLPWTATNWDYAIVWSTDTVWVWDSDTSAWKNTWTSSSWDMIKSIYDTNDDWKVDAADTADSVEWSWVQNKPTTFTPTAHNHNDLYYTESEIDLLLNWKQPLSSILSNTTESYTTTIDTRLANTSWTNTWDNATNSQYSWLATSKQDTLVSWTNIKTVNWTSLLWSWNIVISGWSSAIRRILTVWWTIWTIWTNVWPELTIDWTYTISQINLSYWTSGNWTLTVDINKNGTTLFATTKPSITWTNKYSINTWTLTTTSLASGDILTIDIDAVPWTPWTDLYIEIIYS